MRLRGCYTQRVDPRCLGLGAVTAGGMALCRGAVGGPSVAQFIIRSKAGGGVHGRERVAGGCQALGWDPKGEEPQTGGARRSFAHSGCRTGPAAG